MKRQLSVSKVMVFLLSKEQERDEGLPYKLSSMKYSDAELKQYNMFNDSMFRLDET